MKNMGGHGNFGHQPQVTAAGIGNRLENEDGITNLDDEEYEGNTEDNSYSDHYDYGDIEQTNHDTTVI